MPPDSGRAAPDPLTALRASVTRLRHLVTPLAPERLDAPSYDRDWTIAQLLSHLGSGAVIMQRRFDDALAGVDTDDRFAPSVWEVWNAKTATEQAADALDADQAFVDRLAGLPAAERNRFTFSLGPLSLDFDGFVQLRLNEHTLHTWDVEVALDPTATLQADATNLVIDNIALVAGHGGKPDRIARTVAVHTHAPERRFTLTVTPDSIDLRPAVTSTPADLELPSSSTRSRSSQNHVMSTRSLTIRTREV